MSHLPILPILLPFVAAAALMLLRGTRPAALRAISLISVIALCMTSVLALTSAGGGNIGVYALGDWPAPFGIVLVLDRLAALMVALTAGLALTVVLAAASGADAQGRHFHAFLQLQIAGLNGAFLTGDLFNLFVFFEILLLASYALLVTGGGIARSRAGLGYVILNLAGSALFLVALGLVYGTLGTLNMADLAIVLPKLAVPDQSLARTALALLVAVFLLKAALLPLGFWLPHVYAAAWMPVAALFVIMTKVGIYALLRITTIGLDEAPFTADLLQPWLPWLALATIGLGVIGALAARRLAAVVANLVMISSGTLLIGIAAARVEAHAAALYYLVQTTLTSAALFLFVDLIARQRGPLADAIEKGPRLPGSAVPGWSYLALAVAASGMPPLSGFIAKLMVLQSIKGTPTAAAGWAMLLLAGLVVALVLARAASAVFWEPGKADKSLPAAPPSPTPVVPGGLVAALLLLTASVLILTIFSAPVSAYARATAEQLAATSDYIGAVLGHEPRIVRERRP